jgi:hypothetical protein
MNQSSRPLDADVDRPTAQRDSPDDTLSLKPLIDLLAAYRRVLLVICLASITLGAVVVTALALVLPSESTGSLQFRLLFDGAATGLYPNGTPFSPAEITATPVLTEVYRMNDLQRFGTFDRFKESMSVLQSSFELDLLAADYGARLADPKLGPVDRVRLEDEYRKKREALKDPVFALNIRRTERLKSIPKDLLEKTLKDTLAVWAAQADSLKGAMRVNIPVFTRDVLTADLLDRDLLVAADNLRVQAVRARAAVTQLLTVPGATTLRSSKGAGSLIEVKYTLDDLLRNAIDPAMQLIVGRGMGSDPAALTQYLHGHTMELRLDRDAAKERIRAYQDALDGYTGSRGSRTREAAGSPSTGSTGGRGSSGLDTQTISPQLSESFLDKLMAMSTQTQASDLAYRQQITDNIIKEGQLLANLEQSVGYYEELEQIRKAGTPGAARTTEVDYVKTSLKSAFDQIGASIDKLGVLYAELSSQRLNPSANLYEITFPFAVNTQYALPMRTALLLLVFWALATIVIAPIGCALHAWRRQRVPSRAAR